MESRALSGLTLYFEPEEEKAAALIGDACERSVELMRDLWGLAVPGDLRVYVMTSWRRFMFDSAPWAWQIPLVLTMPLWRSRIRMLWEHAGGWEQRYGRRHTVGIKPPRLIRRGKSRIGDRIFVREDDVRRKVESVTCHELAHAFTSHLKLPAWLKEGLAMVTVDRYFGRPTVRRETLEVLEHGAGRARPRANERVRVADEEATVYQYARGYWLTRYLEDTRPGLLRGLLSRSHRSDELERRIAAAYGQDREALWGEIEGLAVSYYKRQA